MKYKNLMIIITPCILSILVWLSCDGYSANAKRNFSLDSNLSYNRLDSVIINVLRRDKLYRFHPYDTSKSTILISNEYIKPGKVYEGQAFPNPFSDSNIKLDKENSEPENRLCITMKQEKVNFLNISVLFIDIVKLNFDSTEVKLKVSHMSHDKLTTSDELSYIYDKNRCKWILTDSNYVVY